MKNRDGFEAGQRVDPDEAARVERTRRSKGAPVRTDSAAPEPKPKRTASHKGGGYYDVLEGESVIAESVKKAEAEALIDGD